MANKTARSTLGCRWGFGSGVAALWFALLCVQTLAFDPGQTLDSRVLDQSDRSNREAFGGFTPLLGAARCDGSDETAGIQALLDRQPVGSVVRTPPGRWCYVRSLILPPGVTLEGSGVPVNPGGTNLIVRLVEIGGIALEKSGTIMLSGASGLRRMIIRRADGGVPMALPSADGSAYAGDCLTAGATLVKPDLRSRRGSDGYVIDEVLCVGQSRALVAIGAARARIENFAFDVNPGAPDRAAVTLADSHDTTWVSLLRGWPYGRSDKAGEALRSVGTGLAIYGQMDNLQIDGAIIINYDVGVDFHDTAAIDVGRLWIDANISTPNTIGLRFGPNTSNVNISLLQVWGGDVGIESVMSAGNRVSIGIAHLERQLRTPLLLRGGNLHIGNATVRATRSGQPVIDVANAGSFLSGLFNDENDGTTPPVRLSVSVPLDILRDLRVVSPYRAAGTPIYAGQPPTALPVPGTDPLRLLPWADQYALMGPVSLGTILGGSGERSITLRIVTGGRIFNGGNILLASGTDRSVNAGAILSLHFDAELGKWIEVFFRP